jgi:dTDP-4-dehydrorhamnose reductase
VRHASPCRARPILVTGAAGTLGSALVRSAAQRGLALRPLRREELDITSAPDVEQMLRETNAWAVVNAAGFVRVDDAEVDAGPCRRANVDGAITLAAACAERDIPYLTFSSDLVFDGAKRGAYVESDAVAPLGVYGETKAEAEAGVLALEGQALVVRTAAFFGPWDEWNFVTLALRSLAADVPFAAADDLIVTPTYVPDLAHSVLDLVVDGERGIWHLTNGDGVTWAELACAAALRAGLDASLVDGRPHSSLGFRAARPRNAALCSERGRMLPPLDHALARYVAEGSWRRGAARETMGRVVEGAHAR